MREEKYSKSKRRWRCPAKNCGTTRSIRAVNAYFHYVGEDGRGKAKLPLHDILMLTYLWLYGRMPVRSARAITGYSERTIVDWNNFARMTYGKVMDQLPNLVGTAEAPVRIDGSYLSGRRKYER